MKVHIENGKIVLPQDVIKRMHLPEQCEGDLQASADEIKIKIKGVGSNGENDAVLQLSGLGKEIWDGVDPDDYVKSLRKDWE